jgi:hypothetical protein
VVLIDTDVSLIDARYQQDPRFAINREALTRARAAGEVFGMMSHALFEAVGVMSCIVARHLLPALPLSLRTEYALTIYPDITRFTTYIGCTHDDVLRYLATMMSLGDAVHAVQLEKFAPAGGTFWTWNVKDYKDRVAIPQMTPADWLAAHPSPTS